MKFYTALSTVLLVCFGHQTAGYPSKGTENVSTIMENQNTGVYLNVTVYQQLTPSGVIDKENYTIEVKIVPIAGQDLADMMEEEYNDKHSTRRLAAEASTMIPPGGLLGSIESFMKVIPAFPLAAVESVGKVAVFLTSPEMTGINVTQIVTSTYQGLRTKPLRTAVTAFNNVAFCNPLIAGLNYGRCKGFFNAH